LFTTLRIPLKSTEKETWSWNTSYDLFFKTESESFSAFCYSAQIIKSIWLLLLELDPPQPQDGKSAQMLQCWDHTLLTK